MKKLVVGAGAAIVAASIIGGALNAGRESPAVQDAREQDLFSFVRALPSEEGGNLVPAPQAHEALIDPQWKSLFDRHLIPGTEPQDERAKRDIEQGLDGLPSAAKAQAKSVLDKYLRYRQEMAPFQAGLDNARHAAALAAQLRALQELRARIFTAGERQALFRADDEYESLLLARREIGEDASLTEEQKHQRLQQIEAAVSLEARMAEEVRTGVVRLTPEPVLAPSAEGEDGIYRLAGPTR